MRLFKLLPAAIAARRALRGEAVMGAADERCPHDESRIFEGGKCVDDALVALYYFVIGCIVWWLLSQCSVSRRAAGGGRARARARPEGGGGEGADGAGERSPLTCAV